MARKSSNKQSKVTKVIPRPKKSGDGRPCDIFGSILSDGDLIITTQPTAALKPADIDDINKQPELIFGYLKKVGKTYVDAVLYLNEDHLYVLRIREPYMHLMQVHTAAVPSTVTFFEKVKLAAAEARFG